MRTPSLGTLISLGLNIVLSLWLIEQYFSDIYFSNYVNTSLSRINQYVVISAGLAGGSGLGYLLLRRRHPDHRRGIRPLQSRSFRTSPTGNSVITASPTSEARSLPSGAPPYQPSRHTAYAVPPLAKPPSPTGSRGPSTTSFLLPRQSPPLASGTLNTQRPESSWEGSPSFASQSVPDSVKDDNVARLYPTPQINRIEPLPPPGAKFTVETGSRGETVAFRPSVSVGAERKPDSGLVIPRNIESPPEPGTSPRGSTANVPPAPLLIQKWRPYDPNIKPPSGATPLPRYPGLPDSQRRSPPPAGLPPQSRQPGPIPFRPTQTVPGRPPFPQSQRLPKPLTYPGPLRPSIPGRGPVSGPPGPNQPRLTPGPEGPPRQQVSFQAPPNPQWNLPSTEKKESSGSAGPERPSPGPPPTSPSSSHPADPIPESKPAEASPVGEMDWDTALDTILKTLRKDKVEK